MTGVLLKNKRLTSEPSIAACLQVVGAPAWSDAAVDTYMKVEAAKLKPNLLWRLSSLMSESQEPAAVIKMAERIIIGTFLCSFLTLVLSLCVATFSTKELYTVTGLFALSLVMTLVFAYRHEVRSPGVWTTKRASLDTYHLHLEAYVLMRKITAMIPDARFSVSELWQDSRMVDPVLWIEKPGTPGKVAGMIWNGEKIINP